MHENRPFHHRIVYGDTLYSLAKKYHTTVHDILHANHNLNPYNLQIGSVINIVPGHNFEGGHMHGHHTPAHPHTSQHHTVIPPHNIHTGPETCVSQGEVDLNKEMRLAWSQHVYWTRLLIVSIVAGLKDVDEVTNRVLRTATDIAQSFAPYYGPEVEAAIQKLLTEHLVIGKNLIVAANDKNAEDVAKYNKLWYENADQIAELFSEISPTHFPKEEVRRMFRKHLDLTKEELTYRLLGKYKEDIEAFGRIEEEALMMADFFTNRSSRAIFP